MADTISEAQELYEESLAALKDQRRQIGEDLRFSDPSDPQQWEEDARKAREYDPGGKRPCLTLDQTGQYVANVAGQVEQQPPSLHAIPIGGGADKKAAEQIDGRFRHIEYASRAIQHYTRALTSAARTGVGYITVRPEFVNRAMNYQEPRIGSEPDPLKVVFDPWSTETDGKDATFGFILNSISPRVFEKRWPKKAQRDFGDTGETRKRDDRQNVLVAEYWRQDTATKNVVVYLDETGMEQSEQIDDDLWAEQVQASGMPYQYVRSYKDKATVVKWCQMSGADVLEGSEYPADSIGIIPIYGYVGFSDGRMKYCGIPRRARAAQQSYNFHMSELMLPNTMIVVPMRALAGNGTKDLWDRSRVDRRGFMPYTDHDEDGTVQAPTLLPRDSVDHAASAQQALQDIQASIGMYQASLGAPSNETSGVAIESRKEQGEASTAHFPSHMAASLGQVGQIVMQMDARLQDTRRKAPIIGIDESAGQVTVDPEQQEAFKRDKSGVSINPKVGSYGVRVVVGASYSTQRTQTNAAFTEIIRSSKDPAMTATVMPFWAQTLDFPGSDKFAQAMAAMAPAPVKAILQPEGGEDEPDPAAVAQQLDQCKQALQEALQHANDAQDDADLAIQKLADKSEENRIREMEAHTNRLKVTGANADQIQAIVQDLINDMLSQEAPLPGDTPETGMDPALRPQPEPPMPPEPPPEIVALAEGQEQLSQFVQQIAQGQESLAQSQQGLTQMLEQLAALTKRTRKRIPVRDTDGNITEVIDRMEDE